ncbi:MAG: aldehyde dehydrogenase family protein [Planctomycetota bacterium]
MGAADAVAAAKHAQPEWAALPTPTRLDRLQAVRRSIADDPHAWAEATTRPERSLAQVLAAEVGPLADAVQWLDQHGAKTLRPRRGEGDRFGWLKPGSLALRVERKPLGVVLVIGAGNYPLFLLAAPAVQALAAGNAALLKPPPGGEAAAQKLHEVLVAGGVDPRLCPVLDSTVEAAEQAIDAGVDHIVATGSAGTGRAVARRAAETLTPCTLECSGSDAVVVLPGADLNRVADCLAWALPFNNGATCIGPRRLITADTSGSIAEIVLERFESMGVCPVSPATADAVRDVVGREIDAGAVLHCPAGWGRAELDAACAERRLPPVVLMPSRSPTPLADHDLFAPVLSIEIARGADEAIRWANASPYALGASVFGPPAEAEAVARRLRAGCVTVNDVIAPTADPRVPFGGTGESGYGVTRGREGLLAMTRPQAVVRRRGSWLPHLDPETPALADLIAGMIQSRHATGLAAKWRAMRRFMTAAGLHQNQKKDRE